MAVKWIVLAGFYLWLGFTVGYFFRKWLELSLLPRVQKREGTPPENP